LSRLVQFSPEASAELEAAARWYEERHAGLGLSVLAAVDVAIESLVQWPWTGTPMVGLSEFLDVRRLPVSRFPYYLAYLVVDDGIHVLAIAHDRRRPAYWRGRLES